MMRRGGVLAILLVGALTASASLVRAYPLSGYERTGIRRLWAYDPARRPLLGGPSLPPGAHLSLSGVKLRLLENRDYDVTADTVRDPQLQAGLEDIFRLRDPNYSVAVLDITEPTAPRYAALDETRQYLPGSVGKLLVAVGLFAALADVEADPEDRLEILRGTTVTADAFVQHDSHSVPVVDMDAPSLAHRPIRVGDRFSLFEWIDHALSPSSNAAGATMWKQAMLLRAFGDAYPPGLEQEETWLRETSPTELRDLAVQTVVEPLLEADLDPEALRQGTMFTRGAEARVPGARSYASPRELLRLLLRLEQGRVVDEFSSLEIKRLLYFTRNRYRYASSPALAEAAVYFKSGSFYQCREEPGFECRQYAGNVTNVMNSVAIVESPALPQPGQRQRVYLTAMMSNVRRLNSAVEHQTIATLIERLVARIHEDDPAPRAGGS